MNVSWKRVFLTGTLTALFVFAYLPHLKWTSSVSRSLTPLTEAAQASQNLRSEASAALSDTAGSKKLPGLQQAVTVIRDTWGVPHIYAQNEHDLFFAQGFVTAQDRLFQMELWKRAGQGRLAEILGPKYLDRDVNARLLEYRGDMKAEYESYAPDAQQILQAFTEGINAYIKTRLAPGGPGLPLEFKLAGFSPEPWKPEDCLTRMAGFPMTRNAVAELAHAELAKMMGAKNASRLYDFDPAVELDPAPGTDFAGLSPALLRNLVGSDVGVRFSNEQTAGNSPLQDGLATEWDSEHWGSNNWVVSGKLTQTGRPLLANDPHRTVDTLPSLRYLVHLVAPGWDVIGTTEAGSPGVEGGHNERVGFGWTIFGMDQQDLYIEKLDPSDPLRYKTETGWDRMRVEKATFHIKGQADQEVDLKFTRHGPVLWEDVASHRALALRSVLADPGTAGYLACLTMDRVKNWSEFEEAVKRWKAPTHNIVYADVDGNIGEHSVGLEPVRRNWTGLMPEPGDGGYEWGKWISTSELPHQSNPARGFVVTANQRMIPEDYGYKVGYEWAEPDRSGRITELIEQQIASGRKFTLADMQRIQNDITPLPARSLVHLLGQISPNAQDPATQMLLHWDGATTRNSAAAALYELWLVRVEEAVMRRLAQGADWNTVLRDVNSWSPDLVIKHLENPDSETFGNQPSAARDQLMHETLSAAYDQLSKMQGSDSSRWSWGGIHQVIFHHPLESLPEIKPLVDLGPVSRPGDSSTIMNTGFRRGNFFQTNGPTWKEILDVGAWDNSVMIDTPGESGQPGSPHYSDLLPLWDQGQYIPMLYSREAVEKHVSQRMTLEPAK